MPQRILHFNMTDYNVYASKVRANPSLKECISEYTRNSFFYHFINQSLRRLHHPQDSCALRLLFQDLFLCILELYCQQKKEDFR